MMVAQERYGSDNFDMPELKLTHYKWRQRIEIGAVSKKILKVRGLKVIILFRLRHGERTGGKSKERVREKIAIYQEGERSVPRNIGFGM
jgi:hypothetical protein